MDNKQELIVPMDPNLMHGAKLALIIWCIPIFFLASCYGAARYYLTGITYYIISFFITGPLIFLCLMVLLLVGGTFCFPKKDDPVAILNKDGIWLPRFGLIPWKEITEFGPYLVPRTPMEVIAIRVIDNKKISKQSSIAGKLDFFWAKLMGYAPIRIVGIALKNEEVISFAKQFLDDETC